ncbi:MAG: MG2 domain-containing protein [Bradymonadia bacterium]
MLSLPWMLPRDHARTASALPWIIVVLNAMFFIGCGDDKPSRPSKEGPHRSGSVQTPPEQVEAHQAVPVIPPGAPSPGQSAPPPRAPRIAPNPDAAPLSVVVSGPRGPVKHHPRPTITFDRPVHALGAPDGPAPAHIAPPVPGRWRWVGSSTVEFVPDGPVPWATTFSVTTSDTLVALDGGVLSAPHTFTFETPRLQAIGGNPVNAWRDLPWARANESFEVHFNQKPLEADLAGKIVFRDSEGAEVPAQIVRTESWEENLRRIVEARGEKLSPRLPVLGPTGVPVVDRRTVVTVTPKQPLALNTRYLLVIPRGVRAHSGTLPSETSAAWPFSTYSPLKVRWVGCKKWHGTCPEGPITLTFSTPVTGEALKKALKITPPVDIAWPTHEGAVSDWTLYGNFSPRTEYRMKIEGNLEDEFGQRLGTLFEASFITGDRPSEIYSVGSRGLIERGLRAALPVNHVNVARLAVSWAPLSVKQALTYMQGPWSEKLPMKAQKLSLPLEGAPNRQMRSPLDLEPLFEGRSDGARVAIVEMTPEGKKDAYPARTLVQITDLGVHMKVAPVAGRVMVWRLSTGAPVAGAEVVIVDGEGKQHATARTDASGLAKIPGVYQMTLPKKDKWGYPYYGPPFFAAQVTAEIDGQTDVAFASTATRGILSPWRLGVESEWASDGPRTEGLLFTERGIYRPGETIYVKGVLRVRRLGQLSPPENRTLDVKLMDPRGKEVATTTLDASPQGSFHTTFSVPEDGALGQYQIVVNQADDKLTWQTQATVAEYRPPAFLVDVHPEQRNLVAGTSVKATAEGRYLFGGAMSGASVRWSVQAYDTDFTPEPVDGANLEAYTFGRRDAWWDDTATSGLGEVVAGGLWTLDDTGAFKIDGGASEAPEDRVRTYAVEAAVTDVDRQTLAGRSTMQVHPAAVWVGLKGPEGFAQAGAPFDVHAVAVGTPGTEDGGALVSGIRGEVKLMRQVWHTVKKKTALGTFETVSERRPEEVARCALNTTGAGEAPGKCTVQAEAPGFHTLVVEARDAQGRLTRSTDALWVLGEGEAPWMRDDDAKVEVVLDRSQYSPGENARILIQNPFQKAEAWLTVEREGFLWSKRMTLTGNAQSVEIPVTADMIPNAFVGVVLTRGRVAPPGRGDGDPGRPAFRVGYAELKVSPEHKRLQVELSPDAESKRPGESLVVNVHVKDKDGRGVASEVTVWAVDEGVLALTGYQPPDPVASMYRRRGLSVYQSTNLSHLLPQLAFGEKGRNRGGGGGGQDALDVRRKFTTTPLFVGAVQTGDDGKAVVKGQLPDNLTTFRLMALAVTADDRGGVGEGKVVVSAPLMARPALPRMARIGDTFAAGVVVNTLADTPTEVWIEGEILDGAIEGLEPLSRKIMVPPGKSREVRFAFKVQRASRLDAPGSAVRFTVRSADHSDAVEIPLPIKFPASPQVVATYGQVRAEIPAMARTENIEVPVSSRRDVGSLSVTMAASALVGLKEGVEQLIEYPYGCLEQQSSRLVPFVALKGLMDRYGEQWVGDREPAQVVEEAITAITKLQGPDGGFRYWPGSTCAHYWGSAYATLALGDAAAQGYPVDPKVLERARGYLKEAWDPKSPCVAWRPRTDESRAFAAFVLARQGSGSREFNRRLYARRASMALFGKAMLARAMAELDPKSEQAQTLLVEMFNGAQVNARGVQLVDIDQSTYSAQFSSSVRTTAMVLAAAVKVRPDHPYLARMAFTVLKARRGGKWRNTQETAFSLMALADYSAAVEGEAPNLVGRVVLGNGGQAEDVAQQQFQGHSLGRITKTIPLAYLGRFKSRLPIIFNAEGQGPLHYSAVLEYVPGTIDTKARDQGIVVQRWITAVGGSERLTALEEGQVVQVRLRVANTAPRYYVVVDDPIPGGLEAINTDLLTESRINSADASNSPGSSSVDLSGRSQWFSPFDHTEMRDERVVLFADHLPPGVHEYSYTARATTAGTFVHPPAIAEEMYTPEVRGNSSGGSLWVHPRAEQASATP